MGAGRYVNGFVKPGQLDVNPCAGVKRPPPQPYPADAFAAQARANIEAAQKNKRTTMYVIGKAAWVCRTAEEAKKQASCMGGQKFGKGERVTVSGEGPEGGVWKSELSDGKGDRPGFVVAAVLNELPDNGAVEDFVMKLQSSVPEAIRIPKADIDLADFLQRAPELRKRKLVFAFPSSDMQEMTAENATLSFLLYFPVEAGGRLRAPVQFHLKNARWIKEFNSGKKSYSCGVGQCDMLVIVATLTEKTIDRVDQLGRIVRLPVFDVEKLADRYGLYDRGR